MKITHNVILVGRRYQMTIDKAKQKNRIQLSVRQLAALSSSNPRSKLTQEQLRNLKKSRLRLKQRNKIKTTKELPSLSIRIYLKGLMMRLQTRLSKLAIKMKQKQS